MTQQESFKRRVRARMDTTGERYAAARRSLLANAERSAERVWVSKPEMADERVAEATGRGWNEWCDIIDAWPGRADGHAAIAAYIHDAHGIDQWWAQGITVGYERITGLRLPHQMADGTFTANKSRTLSGDAGELREMLFDPDARADLFPGVQTQMRSKPTSKSLRLSFGDERILVSIEPLADGRAKVTITHELLTDLEAVERARFYWSEWLEALDDPS